MANPSKNLEGKRLRLVKCKDASSSAQPGSMGRVRLVEADLVHVDFEDGSTLGLSWDAGDRWSILTG